MPTEQSINNCKWTTSLRLRNDITITHSCECGQIYSIYTCHKFDVIGIDPEYLENRVTEMIVKKSNLGFDFRARVGAWAWNGVQKVVRLCNRY